MHTEAKRQVYVNLLARDYGTISTVGKQKHVVATFSVIATRVSCFVTVFSMRFARAIQSLIYTIWPGYYLILLFDRDSKPSRDTRGDL